MTEQANKFDAIIDQSKPGPILSKLLAKLCEYRDNPQKATSEWLEMWGTIGMVMEAKLIDNESALRLEKLEKEAGDLKNENEALRKELKDKDKNIEVLRGEAIEQELRKLLSKIGLAPDDRSVKEMARTIARKKGDKALKSIREAFSAVSGLGINLTDI